MGLAGSEGFDKIFSPDLLSPYNLLSHQSHTSNIVFSPVTVNDNGQRPHPHPLPSLESTVSSLEEAVLDTQAKCTALIAELRSSESSRQHLASVKQLSQKLEGMQSLLTKLRTQV